MKRVSERRCEWETVEITAVAGLPPTGRRGRARYGVKLLQRPPAGAPWCRPSPWAVSQRD